MLQRLYGSLHRLIEPEAALKNTSRRHIFREKAKRIVKLIELSSVKQALGDNFFLIAMPPK